MWPPEMSIVGVRSKARFGIETSNSSEVRVKGVLAGRAT
jgi:hypothetical protein